MKINDYRIYLIDDTKHSFVYFMTHLKSCFDKYRYVLFCFDI